MAFVGRTRSVARIRSALAEAASGHARHVLVSGVAGIGKTALVGAATTSADLIVGWGTCADAERAPAFWPWTAALRGALADLDEPTVASLAGPDVVELARLLPELADGARPAPGTDPGADPDAARWRLFDAVGRFVERLARRRPTVLVLDDLQWADPSSLELLDVVARPYRPVPLVVIGAYRRDELPAHAARALAGPIGRGELVELEGLSADEVRALVRETAGEAVAATWAVEIHRRSDGHPFFARQLADLLAEPGTRPGAVPPAVRELVLRRFDRLAPQTRALVDAVAVGGTEVRPEVLTDVLTDIAGAAPADIAARVDDAVRAGVLVRQDDGHRMAHDLVREAVLTTMPQNRRVALHRATARALEGRHGRGLPVDPADLARHCAEAVPLDGPERAVRWARAAAAAERARLAFDEAAGHLRRARVAAERSADPSGDVLIDLLVEEADARARGGDPGRGRELLDDARNRARALGDPDRLGRVALGVQRLGSRFAMPRDAVVEVLEEAHAALGGGVTPLEAQVVAALARELSHSIPEHRARAGPLSEHALDLARRLDDPVTLATCLLSSHDVLWTPGRAGERIAIAREIAELAAGAGDAERHAEGLLLTANALLEVGSPGYRGPLTEYLHATERLGQPRHDYLVATRRAAAALLDGRVTEAGTLIDRAAALGERIGEPDAGNVRMSQVVGLVRARGDPAELRSAAEQAVAHWVGVPSHAHAVAAGFLALAGGPDDLAGARCALDTVTALDRWREDRSYLWPVFVGGMATAAARLGDTAVCADLLAELEPVADTCGVNGALVCFVGSNAHWAGITAAALGRHDRARRWLEQALDVHRRLGAAAWEAETRAELAAIGVPGHAERAGELAAELGLVGIASRLATPVHDTDAELGRDGDTWTVRHRDATVHLRDRKGLADLATLLARPGRGVHVLELAGAVHRDDDSGPVLDATARAAYRRRVAELDRALGDGPDPRHGGRPAEERRALLAELGRATGVAGRDRALGAGTTERARKAVAARLRDAIGRIAHELPDLGAHLDRCVVTGTSCRYEPDVPMTWRIRA